MSQPRPGSDCAFLLAVLADGRPHSNQEILARSQEERGCGLTVHSRKSDLVNRFGYQIRSWHEPGSGRRGRSWLYQLVVLPAESAGRPPATDPTPEPAAGSAERPTAIAMRSPAGLDSSLDALPQAGAVTLTGGSAGRPPVMSEDRVLRLLAGGLPEGDSPMVSVFELYRGEWDPVVEPEVDELTDDVLAEDVAELQRALFVEAA